MKRKLKALVLIAVVTLGMVACNSWPTIIATAEAIAQVTSIFFPAVGSLSTLAVSLLQEAENASAAYNANKSASTEAALVAAIQTIETQLPANETALNIPAADQQKVSAAINIILDYVEALGATLPATNTVVSSARTKRGVSPIPPKPMRRGDIIARWKAEVCHGDTHCAGLLK